MGIASLDPTGPLSSAPASQGAAEIKAIKQALRDSFPNFNVGTDVISVTAAQVNAVLTGNTPQTISEAWNFTGGISKGGLTLATEAFTTAAVAVAVAASQPVDATLTALAGLNGTSGVLEQTAADVFTKRGIGNGGAAYLLTRADGDARYGMKSTASTYTSAQTFAAEAFHQSTTTVPTVSTSTNDTNAASTAFVRNAIAAYAPVAPAAAIPFSNSAMGVSSTVVGTGSVQLLTASWANSGEDVRGADIIRTTGTGTFTADSTGAYRLRMVGNISKAGASAADAYYIFLKNSVTALDSTYSAAHINWTTSDATPRRTFCAEVVVALNDGEFVQLGFYGTGTISFTQQVKFTMERVA